jgi:hypothetical protein
MISLIYNRVMSVDPSVVAYQYLDLKRESREAKVINEMVARYRKGDMPYAWVYAKVAEIAGLRSFMKDIENE